MDVLRVARVGQKSIKNLLLGVLKRRYNLALASPSEKQVRYTC